jgi:hypothetical protein
MKKKILMLLVTVLAVAMLAVPVIAKPTNGPNKVAVTVTMTRNDGGGQGTILDPPVSTGVIIHAHLLQGYDVNITFADGSILNGTSVADRKVVNIKAGSRVILTDYYVFDFGDGGFEGNGEVMLDMVNGQSLAYGLFHGTGDFEGQTLNIGHGWEAFSSTPNPWIGYWLKP